MKTTGMKLFRWLALAAALAPATVWAQAKQVTVIIPYGPGGNYDQTARLLVNLIKPYSSEPWIVVNRPGATGTIGVTEAMRAKPDGKTIVLTGSSFLLQGLTSPNVAFKGANDLEQIAIVLATHNVHFVRADAPWKTLKELVEYSKKNPGKINYGVTGPFGVGTVRYLMLKQTTGIEWTEIPYTGDADTMTALLGGHLDTGAAAAPSAAAQMKAGKLRILAVPAEQRVPSMPDVPTFREQGYDVVLPSLSLVMGPKGIRADALAALRTALERATTTPEYRKFADDSGATLFTRFGDQARLMVEEEEAKYRAIAPMLQAYIKANPAGR